MAGRVSCKVYFSQQSMMLCDVLCRSELSSSSSTTLLLLVVLSLIRKPEICRGGAGPVACQGVRGAQQVSVLLQNSTTCAAFQAPFWNLMDGGCHINIIVAS